MFDGLHLGHQAVLETARHAAQAERGLWGVLTFNPHPSAVLRPAQRTQLMMTPEAKRWRLQQLGVDGCIVQPFDETYARTPADGFLPWLHAHLPNLDTIYVGENWRFGHGRGGDVAALVGYARSEGISVVSAQRINHDGEPISSTRIRELVASGDLRSVNRLLGYHYFALGKVETGRRLGRTIGFPTLNVAWNPELRPRQGVYVVRAALAPPGVGAWSPQWVPAVANYGVKPTVGADPVPSLEVHVLGPCPLTYGDTVVVEWLHFLRPERRFANLDELRAQIGEDSRQARAWHERA